jgi:hypothetical protein
MAGTITQSSLSVKITESISLNGVTYGNNIGKTFSSNGKVDQRIMNIKSKGGGGTAWTTIASFSTQDSKGEFIINDYSYFRITNTDDAIAVTLALYNGTETVFFNLEAGESFLLMSPEIDAICEGVAAAQTLTDIEQINAQANSATDDAYVEYVLVTQGGVAP